jgi:hypothetical protein
MPQRVLPHFPGSFGARVNDRDGRTARAATNHQRRVPITAHQLASFLKTVEHKEALLIQRRRDAAVRAVSQGGKQAAQDSITAISDKNNDPVATSSPEADGDPVDFNDLEIYEEY